MKTRLSSFRGQCLPEESAFFLEFSKSRFLAPLGKPACRDFFSQPGRHYSRFLGFLRLERHSPNNPFAFLNEDHLVRLDVLESIHGPTRPPNLQQLHFPCLANSKMYS